MDIKNKKCSIANQNLVLKMLPLSLLSEKTSKIKSLSQCVILTGLQMPPKQAVLDGELLNFTKTNLLKFHIKNVVNTALNAIFQCHLQTQGMHKASKIFGSNGIKYQNHN